MFRIIIWKDNFYLFVYVFFLKISLFSRVIVFLNRLVPINQCPTESNTSKTLLFYRHAQDLKNSTNIADMMMIWMSAQWSLMRTFQRNILRYICNLPVVPKCGQVPELFNFLFILVNDCCSLRTKLTMHWLMWKMRQDENKPVRKCAEE